MFQGLTDCKLCPGLGHSHVPASGPTTASLAFVGQSPGQEEVRRGMPFCGPSGRLLRALLDDLFIFREQVYVTNVVKCGPFKNRPSSPLEIKTCTDTWLRKELELVKPKVVVCLGRDAHQALLPAKFGFTHKSVVRTKRMSFVTLKHPSYFLRTGNPGGFLEGSVLIREELDHWENPR